MNGFRVAPGFLLAVAVLFSSSAVAAKDGFVFQKTDSFSGKTLYFTDYLAPKLDGGSFWSERYVSIKLESIYPVVDDKEPYMMLFDAKIPDWIFITSGDSLELKIDGQLLSLSGNGSENGRDIQYGNVDETAIYFIPPDVLQRMGAAKEIQFRVHGEKGAITGTFTPKMMDAVHSFAATVPGLLSATKPPVARVDQTPTAKPRFGASFLALPPQMADVMKVPRGHGIWIAKVASGLPASKAGVKVGDIIVKFDGKQVDTDEAMKEAVAAHVSPDPAIVSIELPGGEVRDISVPLSGGSPDLIEASKP
jgi:hypothetical protein